MTPILALIWLFGTIASVFLIFRPSPKLPPYANRKRAGGMTAAFFFGIPLIVGIAEAPSTPPVAPSTPLSTSQQVDASSPMAKADAAGDELATTDASRWSYAESRDEMRGTTTKFARTMSSEDFDNSFGMDSEKTELELQKHGNRYDVAVSNSNLQFTCNTFTDTHVSVKFDDGPIRRYGCTNAVGDKFGVAFLNPGERFVAQARKSKRVVVEAEIFQRGATQMSFDIGRLQF